MKQIGLGVLASIYANTCSVEIFEWALNKRITNLELGDDDALHFAFEDGSKIKLYDDGQTCCESRYMHTDDNLSDYIGAKLLGAEIKGVSSIPKKHWEHDIQFLEVKTSNGSFTMVSHNEHNGYYGGFAIRVERED